MRGFYDETGAEVIQATAPPRPPPLVALNRFKRTLRETLDKDQLWDLKRKQGLPLTGVDITLIDDYGRHLPHDGSASGEICVRGPWITASYHDLPDSPDRFTETGRGAAGTSA